MIVYLYNESAVDSRRLTLSAPIETMPAVEGIDISIPSGAIQLETAVYATHFKTTVAGVEWIFEITSRRNLGGNLWTFQYNVDYLKDFYNKYSTTPINAKILRSTNTAYRNIWQLDELVPLTGTATRTVTIAANAFDHRHSDVGTYPRKILAQFIDAFTGGTYVLLMDPATWAVIQSTMYTTTDAGEALSQSFVGLWFVPGGNNLPTSGNGISTASSMELVKDDQTYSYTIPQIAGGGCYRFHNYTGAQLSTTYSTGLSIPHNDWQDFTLKQYTLYIPYIGTVSIDARTIYGALTIRYIYDLSGATIQAVIQSTANSNSINLTPSVELPRLSYLTNVANRQQRQIITQTAASALATGASSAVSGAATGMLAGGGNPIGGAIGGVVGAAGGIIGSIITGSAQAEMAKIGAVDTFTAANGWMGNYNANAALQTITQGTRISISVIGARYGYPAEHNMTSLSGLVAGTHWMDMSPAMIPGPEWYASAVRATYHNQRIVK